MAREEFTLRITRKGEIIVETDQLPPRRVRDLIKFLEETIGPAKLIEIDGASPGNVSLEDYLHREEEETTEEEQEQAEQEKERMRLRFRRL